MEQGCDHSRLLRHAGNADEFDPQSGRHRYNSDRASSEANLSALGQNRCAVVQRGNVGATLSSCIFEEVRLRHHGGLLAAAVPYRKGASHDCSSATNDGGYPGTEFSAPYPATLSPPVFPFPPPLP